MTWLCETCFKNGHRQLLYETLKNEGLTYIHAISEVVVSSAFFKSVSVQDPVFWLWMPTENYIIILYAKLKFRVFTYTSRTVNRLNVKTLKIILSSILDESDPCSSETMHSIRMAPKTIFFRRGGYKVINPKPAPVSSLYVEVEFRDNFFVWYSAIRIKW